MQLCTKATAATTCYVASEHHLCPSQPCTTLDDLILNNSLSNISNVEFKLLPGVYEVTSNIVMQHAHNVSFSGSNISDVTINCGGNNAFVIAYSYNVTISNLIFEYCDGKINQLLACTEIQDIHLLQSASIYLICCSFMSIYKVFFGSWYNAVNVLIGLNVVGISKLTDITMCKSDWRILVLYVNSTVDYGYKNKTLLISRLSFSNTVCYVPEFVPSREVGLTMLTRQDHYDINVVVSESVFYGHEMDPIISARIESHHSFSGIIVKNCKFLSNTQGSIKYRHEFNGMILATIPHTNATLSFLYCTFEYSSYIKGLISVSEEDNNFNSIKQYACTFLSEIKLIHSSFYRNIFGTYINIFQWC